MSILVAKGMAIRRQCSRLEDKHSPLSWGGDWTGSFLVPIGPSGGIRGRTQGLLALRHMVAMGSANLGAGVDEVTGVPSGLEEPVPGPTLHAPEGEQYQGTGDPADGTRQMLEGPKHGLKGGGMWWSRVDS
jgi:hypothetical protein